MTELKAMELEALSQQILRSVAYFKSMVWDSSTVKAEEAPTGLTGTLRAEDLPSWRGRSWEGVILIRVRGRCQGDT